MKKKKYILVVILLMVVGFAAVSTTLFINGQTKINANKKDFNVYYSDAYVNGVQDKSVIDDDTHISFTTTFDGLGQEYTLDYVVTNGSRNYDAELVMICTGGNEYLSVENKFDDESILEAKRSREGKLLLKQIKSNSNEDIVVTIDCTIDANATERTSLGVSNKNPISVEAIDENDNNLNAKAYEIIGGDEEELLNSLVDSGFVQSAADVDALVEVESDEFDNIAYTTFDVSGIAAEGDTVVILHYNDETAEWEYICTDIVDENGEIHGDFTSYSPVAFVVLKDDGTSEIISHSHLYSESIVLLGTCETPSLVEYKCSVCTHTYQEEKITVDHLYEDVYHTHSGSSSSGGGCYGTPVYTNVTCGATVFDDDGNGCETCSSCGKVYCNGEDFRIRCSNVVGSRISSYKTNCGLSTTTVVHQKCSVCGVIKE